MYVDGTFKPNGADYGEYFETYNGDNIDVGYFVTFEKGDKIRIANENDKYILGITSSTPGVIGNNSEFAWKNKYLLDEWGREIKKEITNPEIKDENGIIIKPEEKITESIINPNWDNKVKYISRKDRDEWVVVGLLGQIRVRDNGKCVVDGYCKVGDQGIAVPSDNGYRIIERVGENQIIVLFNCCNTYIQIENVIVNLKEKEERINTIAEENKSIKEELEKLKRIINKGSII